MAKSIVLYGVFLGALFSLCNYFGGAGIGIRYEALGNRASGLRGAGYEVFELRSLGRPRVVEDSASLKKLGLGYEQKFIRDKIKAIYSAEIGVREATGKNDGKQVEEYLAVTQLGKGYAWCASLVSWVFAEAGFPQPRTPWSPALFPKERIVWERGKPGVRSEVLGDRLNGSGTHALKPNTSRLAPITSNLLPITSHLAPKAQNLTPSPSRLKPDPPATADVFGIYFANLKRIAHVGFVDEWGDKYVITVEGNTNEAGSNEGDGVYKKRRLISSIYQVADWVQGQERGLK